MKKIFFLLLFFSFFKLNSQCLYLTSQLTAIDVGDLDLVGNQLTVEALVNYQGGVNVVSKHSAPSNVNYLLRMGTFELTTTSGFYQMANPYSFATNQWYHIAGTYDGSTIKYYVNGCLVISQPANGSLINQDLHTYIGARYSGQDEQFYGSIDEVRIWNVARTQAQIEANMNNLPSPNTQLGLLGYYNFEVSNGNPEKNMEGNSTYDGTVVGVIQYMANPPIIPVTSISAVVPQDALCTNNTGSVSISTSGTGTGVHYSIDGINFGNSSTFAGLAAGNYTATIITPEGCTKAQPFTINFLPPPTATWTTTSLCANSTPINLNTLVTGTPGGTWSGTGVTGNSFNPSGLSGNYAVTYTIVSGPCVSASTQNITVTTIADATIAPISNLCSNTAPITLTAANAGGTWSGTGITNATLGVFDPVSSTPGTNVITYTILGACGDMDTVHINVVTNSTPTWTTTSVCSNSAPVNLNTLVAGTPGGTWSGTGVTGNSFNPSGLSGNYAVTYTIVSGPCVSASTQNITVTTIADATIAPISNLCSNTAPITLTAANAGGTWSGTGITNATLGVFDPVSSTPGTNVITYTILGACGDMDTVHINVVTNSTPTWTTTSVCSNSAPVNLNTLITGTAGGTWSGTGIIGNIFNPSGLSGNYAVTYTVGSEPCISISTQNIAITTTSDATINPVSTLCSNAPPIILTAVDAGGIWSGTGITNATSGMFDPASATPGINIITYTILGTCGDTDTMNINVVTKPSATFTVNNVCTYQLATFTNTSSGATSYSWDFDYNSGIDNTSFSPTHLYQPGIYDIELIAHSSFGCSDTIVKNVKVYSKPVANFVSNNPCLSVAAMFDDLSLSVNDTIIGWGWNFGDGGLLNTSQNPSYTYTNPGTYPVSLFITNNNGCKDTVTRNVIVHPLPDTQFKTGNVCDGNSVSFNNLSGIAPPDNIQSRVWNFGDGSPFNNNQSTSHLYVGAGTYTVKLLNVSNFGCSDSITKISIVNPNPTVSFRANNRVGCGLLCVGFQDSSFIASGGNVHWAWNVGDGSVVNNSQIFDHCYTNDSVYASNFFNVTLTVTSDSGCVSSLSKNNYIKVYPTPNASFTVQPQTTTIANPIISITNLSTGANYVNWNFGDMDTSSVFNPSPHTYADTGTYLITLITSTLNNCIDTAYETIIIEPDFLFYIPNAFTPDGDGVNDSFCGKGIFINEYEMIIFDRWGNKVFFSDDINKSWDGKVNHGSEIAQRDVYVYSIKVTDFKRIKHNYKGTVTLVW